MVSTAPTRWGRDTAPAGGIPVGVVAGYCFQTTGCRLYSVFGGGLSPPL